jgi:hypothetical protein
MHAFCCFVGLKMFRFFTRTRRNKSRSVNFKDSIQVPGGTLSVLAETGVVDQRDTPVVCWENGNL